MVCDSTMLPHGSVLMLFDVRMYLQHYLQKVMEPGIDKLPVSQNNRHKCNDILEIQYKNRIKQLKEWFVFCTS